MFFCTGIRLTGLVYFYSSILRVWTLWQLFCKAFYILKQSSPFNLLQSVFYLDQFKICRLYLTKVLPQVGQDVETSANCIAVLQSGLDEYLFGFCLLSSSKFLNQHLFRAGHYKIPHLQQYLNVSSYISVTVCKIWKFDKIYLSNLGRLYKKPTATLIHFSSSVLF